MISIDGTAVVRDYIAADGLADVLATYDGYENTKVLNGIRYYIFRTN